MLRHALLVSGGVYGAPHHEQTPAQTQATTNAADKNVTNFTRACVSSGSRNPPEPIPLIHAISECSFDDLASFYWLSADTYKSSNCHMSTMWGVTFKACTVFLTSPTIKKLERKQLLLWLTLSFSEDKII